MSFTYSGRGPFTPATPAPTLASFIGQVPATLNMAPWMGCDGKTLYGNHTDFTVLGNTNVAGWATTHATVAAANIKSYDGTPTVQSLTEDNTTNIHQLNNNAAIFGNPWCIADRSQFHPLPYRVLVIAKAHQRTRMVVFIGDLGGGDANFNASVGFDLAGGNTGYDTSVGSEITLVGQQMINLGGGFWGAIFDWKTNTGVTGTGRSGTTKQLGFRIQLDNGTGTAARSVNYAGDGTSGIYLCLCHMLPLVLWNARTKVFEDDFPNLNSIDLNNTKGSQFTWFLDHNFPNSSPPTFWFPKDNTAANAITQPMASIVQISSLNTNPDNFTGSLDSVCYTSGTGLASIQGKSWVAPVMFDASLSYDAPLLDIYGRAGIRNNLAFWGASTETLAGSPLNASKEYIEWDALDTGVGPAQTGLIDWTYLGTPGTFPNCASGQGANYGTDPGNGPIFRMGQFHRFTEILIDSLGGTGVNGWGLVMGFIDGSYANVGFTPMVFQTSDTCHPGPVLNAGGVDSAGLFTAINTQHLMIFCWGATLTVLAGFNFKTWYDWVRVWQ